MCDKRSFYVSVATPSANCLISRREVEFVASSFICKSQAWGIKSKALKGKIIIIIIMLWVRCVPRWFWCVDLFFYFFVCAADVVVCSTLPAMALAVVYSSLLINNSEFWFSVEVLHSPPATNPISLREFHTRNGWREKNLVWKFHRIYSESIIIHFTRLRCVRDTITANSEYSPNENISLTFHVIFILSIRDSACKIP